MKLKRFLLLALLLPYTAIFARYPIYYNPNYNISFGPFNALHSFDGQKYGRVISLLVTKLLYPDTVKIPVNAEDDVYCRVSHEVVDKDLRLLHSEQYLESLNRSSSVARVTEVSALSCVPNFITQRLLLSPMRYAVQGTIDASMRAYTEKTATINLGGGYHHAYANHGEGFCVYSDIGIIIKKLKQMQPDIKVLYVDLDAHQGNGVSYIFKNDPNVIIFDMFGKDNYPVWGRDPKGVKYSYGLDFNIEDKEYLANVKLLQQVIKQEAPDFIFYNAGTDILKGDKLGGFRVSKAGIIQRDEMVFQYAKENNIPVVMVTSGGYTKESAVVIADSITNLVNKDLLKKEE